MPGDDEPGPDGHYGQSARSSDELQASRGTGKPCTKAGRSERPHGVRNDGDNREHEPEEEDLGRHVAIGPVDELGKDGGEKNDRLRVCDPDNQALSERTPVRGLLRWSGESCGERLSLFVCLSPEVDEVGTADELESGESPHRPLGDGTDAVRDGDDLDVLSQRIADDGQYGDPPASRQRPRNNKEYARPWHNDHDERSDHEGEERVDRGHQPTL